MQSLQATDVQHTINKYLGLLPCTSGTELLLPRFLCWWYTTSLKKKQPKTTFYFIIREFDRVSVYPFGFNSYLLYEPLFHFWQIGVCFPSSMVCNENKQKDLLISLVNSRPHLGQMDCSVQHESSSLAQAEKRGGKAVHCKLSFLMKSAWL